MTNYKIKIICTLLDLANEIDDPPKKSALMYAIGYLEAVWGLTETV